MDLILTTTKPGAIRAGSSAMTENQNPAHTVDCIGIALELEDRARTVDSQTTERAMIAAANALRLLAITAPPIAPYGWQLVPVDPTPEMIRAAKAYPFNLPPAMTYQAMLNAAQKHGRCQHNWRCVNDGKHGREELWACFLCDEQENR